MVLKNLKLVALDSNVFIYYFEENPQFGEYSKKIFDALNANTLNGITSTVSLIELLSKKNLPESIAKQLEIDFFEIPHMAILEVDCAVATTAAKIRRKYGFRIPDSIQLATAKLAKAKAFISNDERLKQFKELKIILLSEI